MAEDPIEREDQAEPDFSLDRDLSDAVVDAVEAGDEPQLALLLEPLHPADIADLLEQIGPAQRKALLTLRPATAEGDVLSELEEGLRDEVIADLSADDLAEAVRDLESDDVVDLVDNLSAEEGFDDILHGHQATNRAVFVNNKRNMLPFGDQGLKKLWYWGISLGNE